MQCGHPATGKVVQGTMNVPACMDCYQETSTRADAMTPMATDAERKLRVQLEDREARCQCGNTLPSIEAAMSGRPFEFRGEGSDWSRHCAACGATDAVHKLTEGVQTDYPTHEFRRREAAETDVYRCGCQS